METYWRVVSSYRQDHRDLREGQILFNCFSMLNRQMAIFATGKEFDPFYDDERIPLFLEFVEGVLGK